MPFFVWAFSVSPGVFFQMSPRVYLFFWWFTSLCFSSLFSQLIFLFGLPRLCSGKESTCHCRRLKRPEFDPWTGKIPCRREWHPTPVFLPGEFHGQGGLQSIGLQRVGHDWAGTQSSYSVYHLLGTRQFFFSFPLFFFNYPASQDMCGDNFLKTLFFHLKF